MSPMTPAEIKALVERLEKTTSKPAGPGGIIRAKKRDLIEAATALRSFMDGGWRLVPVEPTEAMLQGACKSHTPGQSMGNIRGFNYGECPSFGRRRRTWADMLANAPLPTPPAVEGEAGE